MTGEPEVLVHIAASATRQNDELFRALANAYTDFIPQKVHRARPVRKRPKRTSKAKSPQDASTARAERTSDPGPVEAPVPSASKDSFGSFPSDVSSYGNDYGDGSVPDDSMRPLSRLAQLDRSYLNWREHAPPRGSFRQGQGEQKTSCDDFEDADTGFIEDSQSALQALQSQLEDTYSTTSADTSSDISEDSNLDTRDHEQPPRESSQAGSQSYVIAEEIHLPLLVEDRVQTNLEASSLKEPAEVSVSATHASQSYLDVDHNQPDFSEFPIDAFPPPPTISVASAAVLPSQITKHLATLKAKNPNRFKPLKIRRDLETDERGYWCVDCTQWSPRIQQEFWSSLCEHVGSGRLGWGMTLHRESGSRDTLGHVRLYCWGEVVEHIWLLMWLSSKGKVSNFGSKWVDADGIAVVEMN
ncbi:hypothetical protein OPT61_g5246 [Boeremia exigua]|uniref:Uncharacterized protein n=1 Tax=Boeremia exigua TaxID=749465 RepID=A0ACC2IB33_9PLEO|nr:hypothetical protein OPT61_g5246 [Boeremia exigua]